MRDLHSLITLTIQQPQPPYPRFQISPPTVGTVKMLKINKNVQPDKMWKVEKKTY